MSSYKEPGREEFLTMLRWCNERAELNPQRIPELEAERLDARDYIQSERCLRLCRQYFTRESPGTPSGGAQA